VGILAFVDEGDARDWPHFWMDWLSSASVMESTHRRVLQKHDTPLALLFGTVPVFMFDNSTANGHKAR
jgi:hypothetical protein